MTDLEEAVADALIKICYGYDTDGYISANRGLATATDFDRSLLDTFLSCLGLAAALYVVGTRYGEKSARFRDEVISRLVFRLEGADATVESVEGQRALIEHCRDVLDRDLSSVDQYTAGYLSMNLMEPMTDYLEQVDTQSPMLQLWVFTFIEDAMQLANTVVKNAESKYNFSIGT